MSDDWSRLVNDGLVVDESSNTRFSFKKMTKKFGKAYLVYLESAWIANEGTLSEEEFCAVNGNVPQGFFEKRIKCANRV